MLASTRSILPLLALTMMVGLVRAGQPTGGLPMLSVQGRQLVNPQGQRVVLRGCNLGNWFLIEPWMFGVSRTAPDAPPPPRDQHGFVEILASRFGPAEAARLIEVHRANWITPRDMDVIRSFGFNTVRLPFHYSLLEDDARPGELRPDAFRWLDRAVTMCSDAGLYVILDLHGTPGGQSTDAPTGRVGQNKLWSDPAMQRRTAHLWGELARHYRDNPAVAAYDIINEPYGDFTTDHSAVLLNVVSQIYDAIRAVDSDRLIYLPGTLRGIGFYADPHDRGWTNVGFTEHFYPGVFAGEPTSVETHAQFFESTVPERACLFERLATPYLIGEFNPIYRRVGGPFATRAYFDRFRELGWGATLWSYRLVTPEGGIRPDTWALATNARPARLDLFNDSAQAIEAFFANASTEPLAVYEQLRNELTTDRPPSFTFGVRPPIDNVATHADAPWTGTDIGGADPGSHAIDGRRVTVCASGADIFGSSDSFRFVSREAPDSFALFATLTDFDARQRFAKAGLMLRASEDPAAPYVYVHAFPDGRVVLVHRAEPGGESVERTLVTVPAPVALGIERRAGQVYVRYTDADGIWRTIPIDPRFAPHDLALVGFAATSHADGALARADFDAVRFDPDPAHSPAPTPITRPHGVRNLLANPSFEQPGEGSRPGAWFGWGLNLDRQTAWSPTHTGSCLLGYAHWAVKDADNAGVWQDVTGLQPGRRYRFAVFAATDVVRTGRTPFGSVELRLEGEVGGDRLTLASRTYTYADLVGSPAWNELAVEAAAVSATMRVLIVVSPSPTDADRRDGALKLDDARLEPADDPVPGALVRLSHVFGDHMVLQRERPIPVFGSGNPGTTVDVRFAGTIASATVDADGNWAAELPACDPGGPHTLTVRSGDDTITISDVLVGDVWVASGQSNMEWPLADTNDAAKWITHARTMGNIRLFHTARDLAPLPLAEPRSGTWETPDHAAGWSAVAFHFARLLAEKTGVPVGIVESAWGGSAIRSWCALDDGARDETHPWISADPLVRAERSAAGVRAFDDAFEEWMSSAPPAFPAPAGGRAWVDLPVPGVWEPTLGQFDGVVWICRTFDVPDSFDTEGAVLELGPIDDYDRTYVNGVRIGQTSREPPEPWMFPRAYPVASGVLHRGTNTVAVQVLDTGGGGGLHGAPESVRLRAQDGRSVPLAGTWRAYAERQLPWGAFPASGIDPEPNFGATSGMHSAMIAPWERTPVRGVIWYQGESDTDRPAAYAGTLRGMIDAWRAHWRDPGMFFYVVQLANFMPEQGEPVESAWAELRESQVSVLGMPGTGVAVTIDIGDAGDIHPRNKEEVGRRLSLLALRDVFGQSAVAAAPRPRSVTRVAGGVQVEFDGAVSLAAGARDLTHAFAVAGADGRFVWAEGELVDGGVRVRGTDGMVVERVRYAWADNPRAPLVGPTGLPVSPFQVSVGSGRP